MSAPAIRIGLIGDYNPAVTAHQAIPRALALAADSLRASIDHEWIPTEEIQDVSRASGFDGLWCVPASPYRSLEGALRAIRFAREEGPAFSRDLRWISARHLEYARNVLGWADADHAETAPDAARPVITPLTCALVEKTDTIRFPRGFNRRNRLWLPGSNRGLSLSVMESTRFSFPRFCPAHSESARKTGPAKCGRWNWRGIRFSSRPCFNRSARL